MFEKFCFWLSLQSFVKKKGEDSSNATVFTNKNLYTKCKKCYRYLEAVSVAQISVLHSTRNLEKKILFKLSCYQKDEQENNSA